GVVRIVAQQHVIVLQHRATSGNGGDDVVGGGAIERQIRVDVPARKIFGGRVGAAVVMNGATADVRGRGEDIRAARGEKLDSLAVYFFEHDTADAAGEEGDGFAGRA